MQTKDGTVTHETFREAWYKRSREIFLSSGENVRVSDKARLNPENYANSAFGDANSTGASARSPLSTSGAAQGLSPTPSCLSSRVPAT